MRLIKLPNWSEKDQEGGPSGPPSSHTRWYTFMPPRWYAFRLPFTLGSALISYKEERGDVDLNRNIFSSQRSRDRISSRVIINMFRFWYDRCGLPLASSHSGRRTFATQIARKLSRYGASIRDLSMVLGHSNIRTTSRYIEPNEQGMTKLIEGL